MLWSLLTKAAGWVAHSHGGAPDVPNSETLGKLGFIMLKHTAWKDVELEQLNPLLDRQMIPGDKIMLARVLLKKGCIVPEHSHENEQVTYILEGALKFWIDGKEIVIHEGEVLCIPSNMPHKAEAVVDTVDLDVFYPPRQDWLNKTDSYLRGKK
jgi:quercetin dioxygenase-like cupin family protein